MNQEPWQTDGRHRNGGTGIADKELKRLAGVLKPLRVPKMPLAEPAPRDSRFGSALQLSKVHWVRPEMVAEVTYLTWAEDMGRLLEQVYRPAGSCQSRQNTHPRRIPSVQYWNCLHSIPPASLRVWVSLKSARRSRLRPSTRCRHRSKQVDFRCRPSQ